MHLLLALREEGALEMTGHDVMMVVLGAVIVWALIMICVMIRRR